MEPNNSKEAPVRRRVLMSVLGASGSAVVMPGRWTKPFVDSVLLPAHAQTTEAAPLTCSDIDTEFTSSLELIPVPGDVTITFCVTNNGTVPYDSFSIGFANTPNGWIDWVDQVESDIGTVPPGETRCSEQTRTVTACGVGTSTWEIIFNVDGDDCEASIVVNCEQQNPP